MKSARRAILNARKGPQSPPGERLNHQDLKVGQKVYIGISFTARSVRMLPARILAITSDRIRVRIPAPPGEGNLTTVRTIKPRRITRRIMTHDVVDYSENRCLKEIEMDHREGRQRRVARKK